MQYEVRTINYLYGRSIEVHFTINGIQLLFRRIMNCIWSCHRQASVGRAPDNRRGFKPRPDQHSGSYKARLTRIRIFFNLQRFLCVFAFRPYVSGESGMRICNCFNPLSKGKIFEYAKNVKVESGYFLVRYVTKSDLVLPPNSHAQWRRKESWILE